MRLHCLWDAGAWQVLHRPGAGRDLVIVLASVGHDPSRAPSPEFLQSLGDRQALVVIDRARSWATAPGFDAALASAMTALPAPPGRILTLGLSMGGFAALRAAEVLAVDAVLAIGPQHRPAAPGEARWRDLTAALDPGLTAPLPIGPQITLLHGMQDDAAQALEFAPRKGVDQVLYPDQGHFGLALHLRRLGLLPGLIDAALQGDRRRLLRLALGAGGVRRQLPR